MLYLNKIALKQLEKEKTFWFSNDPECEGYPVPQAITSAIATELPKSWQEAPNLCLFTSFTKTQTGYQSITLTHEVETAPFFKYYYHYQMHQLLKKQDNLVVQGDFQHHVKVFVRKEQTEETNFETYEVFTIQFSGNHESDSTIKIQYCRNTLMLRQNIGAIISAIKPIHIKELRVENYVCPRMCFLNSDRYDIHSVYPVLNKKLCNKLGIQNTANKPFSYEESWHNIQQFYTQYIQDLEGFTHLKPTPFPWQSIDESKLQKAENLCCDQLRKTSSKNWNRKLLLENATTHHSICVFFILHKDCKWTTKKLFKEMSKELPKEDKRLQLLLHTEKKREIRFSSNNSIYSELAHTLLLSPFQRNTQYLAIIATEENRKIPYQTVCKIKELLLKKKIIPHEIAVPGEIKNAGNGHKKEPHQNVGVKLDQRSWALQNVETGCMIIGMAGYANKQKAHLLGVTFYCTGLGKFHYFTTLKYYKIRQLKGLLQYYIQCCIENNGKPCKIIFHVYENTNRETLDHINKAIKTLEIDRPIILVSIKKRSKKLEIAFDTNTSNHIPEQGTYCPLGENAYLLYNHNGINTSKVPQRLPLKLQLWSNEEKRLQNQSEVQNLMNQVYTLSHMHSEAILNKDLPATIYFPLKLAQNVSNFTDQAIPNFGTDKLWFL